MNTQPKGKIKGVAKKLTLTILGLVSITGIVGAFLTVKFNMSGYVDFIKALSGFYIPLVVSIGYNSAVSKKEETKKEIGEENGKEENLLG